MLMVGDMSLFGSLDLIVADPWMRYCFLYNGGCDVAHSYASKATIATVGVTTTF